MVQIAPFFLCIVLIFRFSRSADALFVLYCWKALLKEGFLNMADYKKIVAVVGMCGSGKSVATEFFCEAGWEKIYFGGLTMDVLAQRGLPKTEANERIVRESLRAEHGPGAFAKLLLPRIEQTALRSNTVLDGLYSWSEYKELKNHFGDALTVLAVITPKKLRYERLTVRKVRPLTFEESEKRDFAEIENIEKGGPIAIADVYVDNSGDVASLRKQLEKLL